MRERIAWITKWLLVTSIFYSVTAFCGSYESSSAQQQWQAEQTFTALKILPEWQAHLAVVYDLANIVGRGWDPNKGQMDPMINGPLLERLGFARILANNLGPSRVIILDKKSSVLPRLESWLKSKNELANFGFLQNLTYLNVKEGSSESDWTRDYIGFVSLMDGRRVMAIQNREGLTSSKALANLLQIPGVSIATPSDGTPGLPGGNIMVDDQGRCFSTADLSYLEQNHVCVSSIQLPKLPYEDTGHVDMFAKLINPHTVLISEYETNMVQILKIPKVMKFRCDPSVQKNSSKADFWNHCNPYLESKDTFDLRQSIDGKPESIAISQIPGFMKKFWPSEAAYFADVANDGNVSADTPMDKIDWSGSLVNQSAKVRTIFSGMGDQVIELPAPEPILVPSISDYYSSSGSLLREEITVELAFRSYTNSLEFDQKVFVPSYNRTVSAPSERRIYSTLEQTGLKIIPIPMNHTMFGGGAVHCLTHEL